MITKEIIDKAIQAHGRWKTRLREFVEGKTTDFDIIKAGTDNNCEFGKWIYSADLNETDKKSEFYLKVKSLHADFHKSIREVAELFISGKKTEALTMITDFNGAYNKISTRLILTLAEWEKTLN